MPTWSANRWGIIMMSVAMGLYSLADACAKLALQTHPIGQVAFLRAILLCAGAGALMAMWPQPSLLRTMVRPVILGRSLIDAVVMLLAYAALMRITIGDLATVNLVGPIIIALLAITVLKEHVSWQQWLAIAIGLMGGIIVVKPTPSAFDPWILFGLAAVFMSALRDLVTRRIHLGASTLALVLASTTVMVFVSLLGLSVENWQPLSGPVLFYSTAAAAILGIANFLAITAVRTAQISLVAQFRYTLVVWGPLFGYLIFHDMPDRWLFLGAPLIVGAGLYTLHHESTRGRSVGAKLPEET